MKYIDNKFYTEVNNPKKIINDDKILRETSTPKSLKTKYEVMYGVKVDRKNKVIIELDGGSFQVIETKKN